MTDDIEAPRTPKPRSVTLSSGTWTWKDGAWARDNYPICVTAADCDTLKAFYDAFVDVDAPAGE